MFNLKTKWFNKWASKNSLSDSDLNFALSDLKENKGVSNLGGNLYKIRLSRVRGGKSGGFRSLLAYKKMRVQYFFMRLQKMKKRILIRTSY